MKFFIFLGFLLVSFSGFSQTKPEELKYQIISIFTNTQADFALAYKNLSEKNEVLFLNEKEEFHAASTITGVRHDSAFPELPYGKRYVLNLLSKNIKEKD